jgi:hypothetical protein
MTLAVTASDQQQSALLEEPAQLEHLAAMLTPTGLLAFRWSFSCFPAWRQRSLKPVTLSTYSGDIPGSYRQRAGPGSTGKGMG